MKRISLIVPCHNESQGVTAFIEAVSTVIQSLPAYHFDLILIDDGSRDQTVPRIMEALRDHPWITLLELTRNFGKEAALSAGLDVARGDALIFLDADLQHPPQLIDEFLRHWQAGARVVAGRRRSRETDGGLYRWLAISFYRLHNRLSDMRLPENVGDFRLIDRTVADQLRSLRETQRFMKGLFAWVGYEPVLVDYEVEPRRQGQTKFNKWRSWNLALEGITSFSTMPLRVWTYVGAFLLMIGVVYALFIIVRTLIYGIDAPGYVTLLTALISFGGVQLIGMGVLGEYVGRIYLEVKDRPLYLVKSMTSGQEPPDEPSVLDGGLEKSPRAL